MNLLFRQAAFGIALIAAAAAVPAFAQSDSSGGQSSGVSIDRLNKEFQGLSPAARDALMQQLEQRGVDGLSHMNEQDARTAFAGLSPDVQKELQAKWDSMSDEDHEALKKLNPDTIKQMVTDKIKETILPSQEARQALDKAKAKTDEIKEQMKAFWARISGKAAAGDQPTQN